MRGGEHGSAPMAVWRNCDDGRVVGIGKREMGGADGGGWSSRPLRSRITLRLTAHHSPTVNAPNLHCAAPNAIRARRGARRYALESMLLSWSWMNNVIRWLQVSKVQGPSERSVRAHRCAPSLTHCASRRAKARARTKGGARFNRASALTTCMLKRPLRTLIRIQCRGKNWSAHARAGQSNEDSLCSVVRTYGWQAQPSRIQAGALAGTWDGQLTTTWRGDDCLRSASSSCSTH